MARIIKIDPVVTVYNEELDQHFPAVPISKPGYYSAEVTIPPNTGEDEVEWWFEAWAKEGTAVPYPTGVKVLVLQGYATEYEYHPVLELHANPTSIGPEGGTVVIVTDFNGVTEWTVNWYNGTTLLKTETVVDGEPGVPPADPGTVPQYHEFSGWDKAYAEITEDTDIYAEFQPLPQLALTLSNGDTVEAITDSDVAACCSTAIASSNITVNGVTFQKNQVVGVEFGPGWTRTDIPDNFLRLFANLTSLSAIPSCITSIGTYFLDSCSKFNSPLTIPASVTSIERSFLDGCKAFNQPLVIPNGVKSIGIYFLAGCSVFNQSLTIPASVTNIGNNFLNASVVFNSSLTISNGVTTIGSNFLMGCKAFNQPLVIPDSVTSIGGNFLSDCPNFNQPLTISNGVTSIGDSFMYLCNAFTGPLNVSANFVNVIANTATILSTTSALALMYTTGVTIKGLDATQFATLRTKLADRTASPFRKLWHNGPPKLVLTLANNTKVNAVSDDDVNACCIPVASTITANGVNFQKDQVKTVEFGPGWTRTDIPDNFLRNFNGLEAIDTLVFYITSIGNGFLQGCTKFNQILKASSMVIPDSVTSVGDGFLASCTQFNRQVIISNGVTSVGDDFLSNCASFNQPLTIPNGVTSIGNDFLANCNAFVYPLTIPASVTSIGNNFLANCNAFTGPLMVSASFIDAVNSSNNTLSAMSSHGQAAIYTVGVEIAGLDASQFTALQAKLPDITTGPFRKLIPYELPISFTLPMVAIYTGTDNPNLRVAMDTHVSVLPLPANFDQTLYDFIRSRFSSRGTIFPVSTIIASPSDTKLVTAYSELPSIDPTQRYLWDDQWDVRDTNFNNEEFMLPLVMNEILEGGNITGPVPIMGSLCNYWTPSNVSYELWTLNRGGSIISTKLIDSDSGASITSPNSIVAMTFDLAPIEVEIDVYGTIVMNETDSPANHGIWNYYESDPTMVMNFGIMVDQDEKVYQTQFNIISVPFGTMLSWEYMRDKLSTMLTNGHNHALADNLIDSALISMRSLGSAYMGETQISPGNDFSFMETIPSEHGDICLNQAIMTIAIKI
jgi:hypothetical protein